MGAADRPSGERFPESEKRGCEKRLQRVGPVIRAPGEQFDVDEVVAGGQRNPGLRPRWTLDAHAPAPVCGGNSARGVQEF